MVRGDVATVFVAVLSALATATDGLPISTDGASPKAAPAAPPPSAVGLLGLLGGGGAAAAQGSSALAAFMPTEGEEAVPSGPDVEFHIYTRSNPVKPQVMATNSTSTSVDLSGDVVVILHGFTGSVTSKSVTLIRDALLFKQNITIVAVQWARLARGPWYDEAAGNTMKVAQHLHHFLLKMEEGGLDLGRVHIIGFSLGAHVAGFTGTMFGGRLGRITGLDPARPGFEKANSTGRLDPSDAQFVVGLHTGAGFVALSEPVGHVDFYPNGGSRQPSCQTEDIPLVCNHFMAYTYFAESIYNADAFPARRCSSWSDFEKGLCDASDMVPMGFNTPNKSRGLYFLRTNPHEPYGLGQSDHRVDLDVDQSDSTPKAPRRDSTEDQSSPHPPLSGGGHHKDIYSVGDGLGSTESIEVQLNGLDATMQSHSSSCNFKVDLRHIFVVLILSFYRLF